jgi:alpha-ketoglutaric semialdehyde dehydrogenase
MMLTGKNYIGFNLSATGTTTFQTVDPKKSELLPTIFFEATAEEMAEACALAERAFVDYDRLSIEKRVEFLNSIVEEINSLQDLENIYCQESGLNAARFKVELQRTVNQIKSFALHLSQGSWMEASIDLANADLGLPDVRKCLTGIGPVAVFGASNFPLAYSTAGGDAISALAAGCPVIVKAHPMHNGTSELVAHAIIRAARRSEMPNGVFSHLNSSSFKIGQELVRHSAIKAVGFTGSFAGGKALYDIAVKREEPIPFFGEMGSLNPVFISGKTQGLRLNELVDQLVQSVTKNAGQFCTKPGLIFLEASNSTKEFCAFFGATLEKVQNEVMLGRNILSTFDKKVNDLQPLAIETYVSNQIDKGAGASTILIVDEKEFFHNPSLNEEVFGPFCIVVICSELGTMHRCHRLLKGQLTNAIHCEEDELEKFSSLFESSVAKVGRIIYNGVPTGVRVCPSMTHGGPFPATTDPRFTAVGVDSIKRFLRPVTYQNYPEKLLPDALKDINILKIPRRIDGQLNVYDDVHKNAH